MNAKLHPQWIVPDWPAPAKVRCFVTTRAGGVSTGPYGDPYAAADGGGMNLGLGSGDDRATVLANRAQLRGMLPSEPLWLSQVHGATVVENPAAEGSASLSQADACVAHTAGAVCAVLVADCMPVLLTSTDGRVVGAAHAGWRGLAAGVIQNTVMAMRRDDAALDLIAWLGPAIGPRHFEVGAEVLEAMTRKLPDAAACFVPAARSEPQLGKFYADLFALGRQALAQVGVTRVYGGGVCTASDAQRFYSFRRNRVTGRHAALIWREA
jgi:YfiH family protein